MSAPLMEALRAMEGRLSFHMPGHKGLYGPQGTGLLLCGREEVSTVLEGGTGSASALT